MSKVIAFNPERRRSPATHTAAGVQRAQAQADPHAQPLTERRRPGGTLAPDIAISIVVPTRGRPQLLNRCVASLVLQDFDRRRFEIIVVDDGPSRDTHDVVAGWITHTEGNGPAITYLPSFGPHGPAAARNQGWRAARGDIIAFTDDDTIARSDWLRKGLREFEKDQVDAVCGRIIMPLSGTPTDYQLDAKNLETAEFVTAH